MLISNKNTMLFFAILKTKESWIFYPSAKKAI